jgi:ABC-2 type transport system ATP-binding protein
VGLDQQSRQMMWTALRQMIHQGSSIVLTTHYLEEAEALADRVAVLAKGRPIATGTVSAIRALVVRKHITCSTNLSVEQVTAWPDVETAALEQKKLHVTASNAEAVVRRLLAADENLQELEVRRAGLAEAFTELTQEAMS